MTRTVAVTGASGFLGSALVPRLRAAGHTVLRVRRAGGQGGGELTWDPAAGQIDPAPLEGVDAIIHLSGADIAQRWSPERKREIWESRVRTTELLARTMASLRRPPSVFLSTSAIGIYGDRGDEPLDEWSSSGTGFLADLVHAWEAAADPARRAGVRVVHPRNGIVLDRAGGALARLLPIFSVGAGGKIGSGAQWMSWISLDDWVRAYEFLLADEELAGAVNVTSPNPATNADFAATLGRVMRRPAIASVPAFAVKLMFGEMGEETVLSGQRVMPSRLRDAGFTFTHPALEDALRSALHQQP